MQLQLWMDTYSSYIQFLLVGGRGEHLPPNLQPSPLMLHAVNLIIIALNCVSGDLKFKIFWGETPRLPLVYLPLVWASPKHIFLDRKNPDK